MFGIIRNPANPQNATYTGVAQRVTRYDTTQWKYEVRIALENAQTGGQIFLYKENNSEWIPLPK